MRYTLPSEISNRSYGEGSEPNANRVSLFERWGFLGIALLFLLWRVPVMYLDPAGQDEEYYAVPGLTVLQSGLPRLPHVPGRTPESVFLRADECLFAEPPAYFYLQAIFYAFFPDGNGTARLATGVSGLILLYIFYRISRRVGASPCAAIWSVGLLSISRWFFFPAIAARPDMLCGVFGLMAVLTTFAWKTTGQRRWLVATGLAIGLGGLSHAFAIAYAVQICFWIFFSTRKLERIVAPAIVTTASLGTAALWLILILQYPDLFHIQFGNQYFVGTGDSMLQRLIWPWKSLDFHAQELWNHIGPWQSILALSGWLYCGVVGYHKRSWELFSLWWLAITSFWLIASLVGPSRAVFGYWMYTAPLMFVGVSLWIDALLSRCSAMGSRGRVISAVCGCLLVATMLPGSGLRTLVTHLQHRGDVNYNAPQFAQSVMQELPASATFAVDTQFVMDFLASGRKTLLAEELPNCFPSNEFPFDYLIVSRHGIDTGIARQLNAKLLWTRGHRDDPFACYAEVYARE